MRPIGLITAVALCLGAAQAAPLHSVYTTTPIGGNDCQAAAGKLAGLYKQRGLDAAVCPGVKNWRLIAVSYDPRSWPELERDKTTVWQMDEVAHSAQFRFGNFINFDAKQVEWRVTQDGVPQALIFRQMAQDDSGAQGKTLSRLFVVDLRSGEPKLCGMVKSNEEARALADQPRGCTALKAIKLK